jgi:glycosyltransferase involved in cell wall biosynthesis
MPLISVVIATYRRPKVVVSAIESALAQTMSDLEVIVAVERDDAATVAALEALADPRVRYVVNPEQKGPGAARDFAVLASSAQWIAFLDDDDGWLPTKLEKQLAASDGNERTIVTCLSQVVTPIGNFVRPSDPYTDKQPIDEWLFSRRSWLKGGESMLQTSSLLIPKQLFATLRFGQVRHEEWELVIRAVKQFGYHLVTVPEVLVVYQAGNTYAWRRSADWIDSVRDLVSPTAYAGFCLNVATQGLRPEDRAVAIRTFLRMALRNGRPTARQLFAFAMIWLVPDALRLRMRSLFSQASKPPEGSPPSSPRF